MSKNLRMLTLCFSFFVAAVIPCDRNLFASSHAASLRNVSARGTARVDEQNQTGVLHLPDGSRFQTTLFDMTVIGKLRTVHKLPYYVLSGVGCNECDADVSIYIHSPSDGPMRDEGTQQRFDYPGQTISREDRSVVSETRVFFGSCAVSHPDAVIWFERYIGEDKKWHKSVDIAEVKNDRLAYSEPKTNVPTITGVEAAVRKSQCREIPGIKQWEEP